MLTAVFKLVTDKADPIKVHSHGEFIVFRLHFPAGGTLLCQCLMIESQSQHYIGPDFSGMQIRIEATKLNSAVAGKKAVKIEKVVTAVVIMLETAFPISFIPDGLNLRKAAGLSPVHLFD